MNKETKITIQEHFKINGLVSHVISPDGKYIAVSLKAGPSIEIYELKNISQPSTWQLKWKLKEQSQQISEIDWSLQNNLLTSSFDRSAVVWNLSGDKWQKDLVVMESSRALLCAQWAPSGKKFAVGGGDYKCFIGYYEKKNKFWQTKRLESCKSSLTSIAFHPSGRVVACGSTDNSITIYTCYIQKDQDDQDAVEGEYEDLNYKGPFSTINTWNEQLLKIADAGGWIEGIAFSPSGTKFAYTVHNGTICHGNIEGEDINLQKEYNVKKLPFKKISYVDDNTIAAGGYDMTPSIFKYKNQNEIEFVKTLENPLTEVQKSASSKIQSLQSSMFNVSTGQKTGGKHTTPILCIRSGNGNKISTSDMNGSLLFWEV